ncbi:MAG: helix-turn-helix transcriptional regulator [Alphaproteobacteria bacterium]|nr:helix-turn-helix transcriptional regulator [Alphaproteobacteria bacterium]
MFTHEEIWNGIDRLAEECGYSPSGLAKQAGLDSTSFNKSKRFAKNEKPRWPSTESIAKVLNATNTTLTQFSVLMNSNDRK